MVWFLVFFQEQNNKSFQIIEVRVLSNWGHPEYTCLYRFRVHGDPQFQWIYHWHTNISQFLYIALTNFVTMQTENPGKFVEVFEGNMWRRQKLWIVGECSWSKNRGKSVCGRWLCCPRRGVELQLMLHPPVHLRLKGSCTDWLSQERMAAWKEVLKIQIYHLYTHITTVWFILSSIIYFLLEDYFLGKGHCILASMAIQMSDFCRDGFQFKYWTWIMLSPSHNCFFPLEAEHAYCLRVCFGKTSTFNFTAPRYNLRSLCSEYRRLFTSGEYVYVKGQTYTFTVKCIIELHESAYDGLNSVPGE